MKNKKIVACALGISMCIGVLSGCGANDATIDRAELEQQIKPYLDANMESCLNDYFGWYESYSNDDGQEPDRTQFSDLKLFTAETLDGDTFTQEDIAAAMDADQMTDAYTTRDRAISKLGAIRLRIGAPEDIDRYLSGYVPNPEKGYLENVMALRREASEKLYDGYGQPVDLVIEIGQVGFWFIGISFFPLVTSLIFPVFFQAVGASLKSSLLTVIRTMVLFVPLGFVFSRFGLDWFWLTFPVTETLTSAVGMVFYRRFLAEGYTREEKKIAAEDRGTQVLKPSKPGVIITIAREHGSSGKQIGKLVARRLGIPFYYNEMIALAAHESGLDQEFISDIHKKAPDVLCELCLGSRAVQYAIRAQEKAIRRIAENGSCVIVGRAADHVLRQQSQVVRIFRTKDSLCFRAMGEVIYLPVREILERAVGKV